MNSAEVYMKTRVKLDKLGGTMLNGPTPETLEHARQLIGMSKELFDVIDEENRATLQREEFRLAQVALREARQGAATV